MPRPRARSVLGATAILAAIVVVPPLAAGARVGDATARAAKTVTKTLTLGTSSPVFRDTGVKLAKGASATISVTGDGTCHAPSASDCPTGPNGAGFTCASNPIAGPVPPGPAGPDVPYGAVAGRVGKHGKPFLIGKGRSAAGPGELYLVYNDCDPPAGYGDNGGSFRVSITYEGTHDLAGAVLAQKCSKSSCSRRPRAGVTVLAKAQDSGATTRATTGHDGHYRMKLDEGIYDVSLSHVKGMPAKRRVSLTKSVKGVDFRTCASGGTHASARARIAAFLGCLFIVKVTVVDLTGAPLPNVTLLADRAGTDDVDLNAAATTNAAGEATFDLYEDTWSIQPATSVEDINPAGTSVGPSFEPRPLLPHGPGYDYEVSQCLGGTVKPSVGIGGPRCVVDLAVGKRSKSRVAIKASVGPIDVSLAAGLGLGQVNISEVPQAANQIFLQWLGQGFGNSAPRNRLHFEVPLSPAGRPAVSTWDVGAAKDAQHPAPPSACSPGHVTLGASQRPVCELSLGGGVVQGAASFSLPPG